MTIVLSRYGRSFATRSRARELVSQVAEPSGARAVVSCEGVFASPSFLAEFLSLLCERFGQVEFRGADESLAHVIRRLIVQLQLEGRAVVDHATVPA